MLIVSDTNTVPHYSETLTLGAGESAELIYTGTDQLELELTLGVKKKTVRVGSINDTTDTLRIPKIVGPLQFCALMPTSERSLYPQGYTFLITFKITRSGSGASFLPSNSVVIPSDAGGQFEVILESSTDLINWSAALPGTYGGDTVKRFFRTRIVRKP